MKRAIRFIGRFILIVVGIHLLIGGYLLIRNRIYLGSTNEENTEYLKVNVASTPLNTLGEDFFEGAFEEDFYRSNIFLLGENHGFADVQEVDLALLKHLNRQIDLRYYIAEMDRETGEMLNSYLRDSLGNLSTLEKVILRVGKEIPQQASMELFHKWKKVREYNQSLPDSLRISVLGIDKDNSDTSSQMSRDSAMIKNLTDYIKSKNLQDEKFYGLFGYFHVMQQPVGKNTEAPFASRLKESSFDFFAKVSSIVTYHIDSEVYFPKNDQFPTPKNERISFLNDDGPIVLVKGIEDLKEVTEPNTISIFNLNGEDSPYKKSKNLAGIKVNFLGNDILPLNQETVTPDYFEYVVLGRNAKALTKYQTIAPNTPGH